MNFTPIIKPVKDLVEAVKAKTDNLPTLPAPIYENNFLAWPALSWGVTVTSNAVAWTLGNWTQVIAACAITVDFCIIGCNVWYYWGGSTSTLLEIGIGGAASENMIIQLPFEYIQHSAAGENVYFPVFFPPRKVIADSRVSARFASTSGGDNVKLKLLTVEI